MSFNYPFISIEVIIFFYNWGLLLKLEMENSIELFRYEAPNKVRVSSWSTTVGQKCKIPLEQICGPRPCFVA